jgi:DNA modification methylase
MIKTVSQIDLDPEKLNVSVKTRSNIFNWRGQFTPEFVEYILDTFACPTSVTFDPFCGSGTVLLESARRGLASTGFEINPAAYAMARFVSLSTLSLQERKKICSVLKQRIESLVGSYHDLPLFESESTFRKSYGNLIHFAGDLLSRISNKNEMVLALICLFHAENGGRRELVPTIQHAFEVATKKLEDLPLASSRIEADLCDARLAHERLRDSVNIIVTSPPYINVFNYHQNYRAIMEVLGFDILKVAASEFGANRKNRGNRFITVIQYAIDMEAALASFARCLARNGILVLVVGRESRVRGIPFSNSAILLELAKALGSYGQVTTSERVFVNRFGKNIKEDILVLKKINGRPQAANARQVATKHLRKALETAEGEIAEDVMNALAQVPMVQSSPLFSKKGII